MAGRIVAARAELEKAQQELGGNIFDRCLIEKEVEKKSELRKWLEVEEKIMAQKAKINWLNLGDGNNKYFHAAVKEKNRGTRILKLIRKDGIVATEHKDLEHEVLDVVSNYLLSKVRN